MALKARLATVTEAAEYLRVDPSTVYRMLKRREIPGAIRVGGLWRIDLEELQRILQTRPKRLK